MAKIGLPKGSGKRLKVREKSAKSQGILKWILSGNPELKATENYQFSSPPNSKQFNYLKRMHNLTRGVHVPSSREHATRETIYRVGTILPARVNPPHKTWVYPGWAIRSYYPLWAICGFYEYLVLYILGFQS